MVKLTAKQQDFLKTYNRTLNEKGLYYEFCPKYLKTIIRSLVKRGILAVGGNASPHQFTFGGAQGVVELV